MNPVTPQQFKDLADQHRRDLIDDLAAERARAARRGRRPTRLAGRLAMLAATAAIGAVAFVAGGLLDNDPTTATPPVAARGGATGQVADAAPDCPAPDRPRDRAPSQPPRFNRQRDRLTQIPV